MKSRIRVYQHVAAMFTCLVIVLINGWILWGNDKFFPSMLWQVVLVALTYVITSPAVKDTRPALPKYAFWAMLPIVFVSSWGFISLPFFIYSIIWIANVPYHLPKHLHWWSLLFVSVVWLLLRLPISELADAVIRTLLEATFHMFALITAIATRESELANENTQRLNRELIATQHLLGEASRDSERTRIARDLHDLLGHHLTALTIHLQVAGRLSEGKAKESVDQCYALSKLLLSDVRQSVSQLKEMPTVSLAELLAITVNDIPRLDVSLDIEHHIDLNDVDTADTLLRFVQEAITNTLRHSKASKATISAVTAQSQITVTYTDNGGGCDTFEAGNGINGMIERLERLGGKLSIECQPTLTLKAIAPLVD